MTDEIDSIFADVDTGLLGPVDDLLRAVERDPDRWLMRTLGDEITVGELAERARSVAVVLQDRGIERGDRVALVGGNTIERAVWMFGIWWIGAVEVSVNFELHGPLLRHVLDDSDPTMVVCEPPYVARVSEVSERPMLVTDQVETRPVPPEVARTMDDTHRRFGPGDMATILFTSGTTGPAKGVMLPRAYFSNLAQIWNRSLGTTSDDVGYFPMPFFHVDGHVLLSSCLQSGSHLAFRSRFSVSEFWNDIGRFSATWSAGVGSMLSMIATTTPPAANEHSLRRVIGAPIPDAAYEYFEDRLGVPVLTLYGQTECDAITIDIAGDRRRGAAGRVHPLVDVRIVDADDLALPAGEVGQIVFRPQLPWLSTSGYWNRPEQTVESWRNLWFHTGDAGRLDDDGFLYFIGRRTDSFRRRGENISAWELEHTLLAAPHVTECVAIAVPDEHGGEDEIKVFVVPEPDSPFDLEVFMEYCRTSLPRYACPRWVSVTDGSQFVRSPGTGVVQKHFLSRDVGEPAAVEIKR